jgi:hypothetical protein
MSNNIEFDFEMAELDLKGKRFEEAEAKFISLARETKNNPKAWLGLGIAKYGKLLDLSATPDEVFYCFEKAKLLEPAKSAELESLVLKNSFDIVLILFEQYLYANTVKADARKQKLLSALTLTASSFLGAVSQNGSKKNYSFYSDFVAISGTALSYANYTMSQKSKLTAENSQIEIINLINTIKLKICEFVIEQSGELIEFKNSIEKIQIQISNDSLGYEQQKGIGNILDEETIKNQEKLKLLNSSSNWNNWANVCYLLAVISAFLMFGGEYPAIIGCVFWGILGFSATKKSKKQKDQLEALELPIQKEEIQKVLPVNSDVKIESPLSQEKMEATMPFEEIILEDDSNTSKKKYFIIGFIILIAVAAIFYLFQREKLSSNKIAQLNEFKRTASSAENTQVTEQNNNLIVDGKYPHSSERILTAVDLSDINIDQLKIMRNEIYARHGFIFQTGDMKIYFESQKWYKPLYNDISNQLSNIEKTNVDFLLQQEKIFATKPNAYNENAIQYKIGKYNAIIDLDKMQMKWVNGTTYTKLVEIEMGGTNVRKFEEYENGNVTGTFELYNITDGETDGIFRRADGKEFKMKMVSHSISKNGKKLRYLFYSNGGLTGYFDDGTIANCPRCDLLKENIKILYSLPPFLTYTVENGFLLVNGNRKEYPKGGEGLSEGWALIDYEWLIKL